MLRLTEEWLLKQDKTGTVAAHQAVTFPANRTLS
jgi:hypothetical protein